MCSEGCEIKHVENCPDCFGFGFFSDARTGPARVVRAGQAAAFAQDGFRPGPLLTNCETCGSGIEGAAVKPLPA